MGFDPLALFCSPSFDISLHAITRPAAMSPPSGQVAAGPANAPHSLSSVPCLSPVSESCSPPACSSPPLSPRSQFAALTVHIPPSPTSSHSAASSLTRLALPTLPTTLTDPSQLRLFWPHHYYGADVDRIAAPTFQEWKQRPFYLASLREASRRNRRCLRCKFNPQQYSALTSPLTPPTLTPNSTISTRPSTPPVQGSAGVASGLVECVRAPRKPWYSAEFMKELSRREKECTLGKQTAEASKKRLREEDSCSAEEEGRQQEASGEQQMKKARAVSWEAEEVSTLSVWSGLPPKPVSPTKASKSAADSSPLFTLPLSPTLVFHTLQPPTAASPPAASACGVMPLSPMSGLCGSMGHLLSPLSPRNDVRPPVRFQRLQHSPLFRKQRRVLPPVPKMSAA